uniref:Outer membrane lipoprotein-sorting protein n=1 Tax=Candidatus Kentrum sp. FW TaxID=2126338 RepID=A0A450TAY6_9GAMM|nr:MAG: outer membrane lipoprotein-sorting protein [Candidatus Kentron sp. FW]
MSIKKNFRKIVCLTCILSMPIALAPPAIADTPAPGAKTGRQVMELARQRIFYAGHDRVSSGHVTVRADNGAVRIRDYRMLRLNGQGQQQHYFVYFTRPGDLVGTTFLVHKKPGTDDDRWLYLPKLDLVRRISAGDKRTHFVGTDMFYEDVSGRHVEDDNHVLDSENEKYWIVRSKPTDTNSAEFAWYRSWIHKKTHLPIKVEYHDNRDKIYRRIVIKKVRKISGIPTPTKVVVHDLNTNSRTTGEHLHVEYGKGIPKHLFSERSLRNPPKKWLGNL